ncbi:MAG: helix-turn-helix domain-containing protein [Pseudonocardia sp.]
MKLYDFAEAADELRVEESWLRRHSKRLPRQKFGRTVRFSDADLDRIREIHHVEPEQAAPVHVGSRSPSELKPLPARSSRTPARTA